MVLTGKLVLDARLVSSNNWQQREYQEGLPNLSQMQGEKGISLITNQPVISGLSGVTNRKLIQCDDL